MARTFNGTDTSLDLTSAVVSAYPITIACWCNIDNITAQHFLVSIADTAGDSEYVALIAKGDVGGDPIRWGVVSVTDPSVNAAADTSTGYSAGVWHHACGVSESALVHHAYIDGGSKGSDTSTDENFPVSVDATSIGRLVRLNPAAYTAGKIAEVGIWDVVLTDGEVKGLAAGLSPVTVRPANLVSYWPIYGLGSPEPDLSGNKNNLTLTNAPAAANHASIIPYSRRFWGHGPLIEVAAGGGSFPPFQPRHYSPLLRM